MLLNLNESNVYLGNTTNKLLALSHSQFVENRVYDEDETIANIVDVPVVTDTDKVKMLNKNVKYFFIFIIIIHI